ncbi:MAG: hypothetical protein WC421_06645 [Elusimicrobiales bacterium]
MVVVKLAGCGYRKTDLQKVVDVQSSLAIFNEIVKKGENIAPKGLLISGHTIEQLESDLNHGGMLYAVEKDMQSYNGYLLSTNGQDFANKLNAPDTAIGWRTNDKELISSAMSGQYDYLDQIGVRFEAHGHGVAEALLKKYEEDRNGQLIVVLIMTAPVDNLRSTAFFKKHNYRIIADVKFSKYGTVKDFSGIILYKEL